MNKSKLIKSFMTVVFLMLATLGMMNNAYALPAIQAANGVGTATDFTKCSTCHAGGVTDKTTGRAGLTAFCGSAGFNASTFVCNPPPPTVPTCSVTQQLVNNACVPKTCPTGQTLNAAGACITPAPTVPTCSVTQQLVNNACVPKTCPTGQTLNAAGACVTSAPTVPTCSVTQQLVNNACVPKTCPTGQTLNAAGACATTPPPVVTPPVTCNDEEDDEHGDRDSEHDDDSRSGNCQKHESQSGSVGERRSGKARTDVYAVTCASGSANLSASVKDLEPVKAPMISIQTTKGTASSSLSTDDVDGDDNHSSMVKLAGGSGVYMMKINKSESNVVGAETYVAKFQCQNAAGNNTGTKWEMKQNQ